MHTESSSNIETVEQTVAVMNSVLIDLSCYIHEIPLNVYRLVCIQLDQKERWQRLARVIGYDCMEIEKFRQSNSPATKLLSKWSDEKHTVTELYMALHQIGEFGIMEHLLELVDRTYHRLLINTSKSSSKVSSVSTTKSHNSDKSEGKRRQHNNKKTILDSFKSSLNSLGNYNIGIPRIPFNELSTATDHWDTNKVLGTGGYSTVYRGNWKMTEVAIKRFNCHGFDRSETIKNRLRSIVTEMRFLNKHRQDNILPLYGYSFEGTTACLVYQMMVNGSLEQCLQQKKIRLTYKQRLNIAIGTARGIQFLHTFAKKSTVHGDIKSANILLDSNFQPKIGDFGLAHHANGTTKSKRIYGTRPYMADDFFETMIITTKNDVFSMGVVLFELATSLLAYDEKRGKLDLLTRLMRSVRDTPEKLADLIDAREKRHSSRALPVLMKLIKIGFSCTKSKAIDRPEMSVVLNSLLDI